MTSTLGGGTVHVSTRSLGHVAVTVSLRRRSLGFLVYVAALGGRGAWLHSDRSQGWYRFRLPATQSARLPYVLARLVRLYRDYAPRARHWALLGADVDCDGTSWHAHRVRAWTEHGAMKSSRHDTYDVMTERAFKRSDYWRHVADGWDRDYWHTDAYARLGASWD